MKREIKFRAWDGNRMIYWNEVKLMRYIQFETFHSDLMQYTGFNDKNGNEVYEGDILRTPHIVIGSTQEFIYHKIIWNSEWYLWQAVNMSNIDESIKAHGNPMLAVYIKNAEPEIFGNLYEKTELINQPN